MPRFSINLPIELDTWLQGQADDQQRTKNAQLIYFLEQVKDRQPRQVLFVCGNDVLCCPDRHNFGSDTPMEGEACNCGKVRW